MISRTSVTGLHVQILKSSDPTETEALFVKPGMVLPTHQKLSSGGHTGVFSQNENGLMWFFTVENLEKHSRRFDIQTCRGQYYYQSFKKCF